MAYQDNKVRQVRREPLELRDSPEEMVFQDNKEARVFPEPRDREDLVVLLETPDKQDPLEQQEPLDLPVTFIEIISHWEFLKATNN